MRLRLEDPESVKVPDVPAHLRYAPEHREQIADAKIQKINMEISNANKRYAYRCYEIDANPTLTDIQKTEQKAQAAQERDTLLQKYRLQLDDEYLRRAGGYAENDGLFSGYSDVYNEGAYYGGKYLGPVTGAAAVAFRGAYDVANGVRPVAPMIDFGAYVSTGGSVDLNLRGYTQPDSVTRVFKPGQFSGPQQATITGSTRFSDAGQQAFLKALSLDHTTQEAINIVADLAARDPATQYYEEEE